MLPLLVKVASGRARAQNPAMPALNYAAKRLLLLPYCFPASIIGAGKQKSRKRCSRKTLIFQRNNGAGEGIRTLDPNLGKVVLYP